MYTLFCLIIIAIFTSPSIHNDNISNTVNTHFKMVRILYESDNSMFKIDAYNVYSNVYEVCLTFKKMFQEHLTLRFLALMMHLFLILFL